MSLTVQQIICDAKKLVGRISDHENTADNLITEIQSVCNQIDNMKQYQEEIEVLNNEAKQQPRDALIAGIQQETKHLRELQAENKELRNALEEHQNTIELIMSKYRQHTASLIKSNKINLSSIYNARYANIITNQAEKINEMAAVMRVAANLDEECELKYKENLSKLKAENNVLRELVNIANSYGSLDSSSTTASTVIQDNKTVQTDTNDNKEV
ncbi:Similar to fgfr1op2: FGFR1 oncogene partner 2 homolog (Danio rerio) [Cotesia congregata]|uniref:Similar to fgfr1op2: FGFR1 oncogene partner 2 homolog (Danio rerio) n=1 Tax=Cotesia congregata TaxID=51543 RepID=A0A8J2H546_COTCN|nr:Similar to fgfr1op2: FGFR1 oncogene partner 2 homolog (Danio rerio) [Cotesia congregata]